MTLGEPLLNRDQAYGAVALIISLAVAVLYLVSLFPSCFALSAWLAWWAIALRIIMAVLAVLTICAWIGWVMLTTPPVEEFATSTQPKPPDEHG
jgi:uncharacterized membrane protein YcjF (UPF0283 family)